jgi:hypothetical protein
MKRALTLIGAALAGALALALAGLLFGGSDSESRAALPTWRAPDKSFSIATPAGWRVVADGRAATVLQRTGNTGTVVIRRHARFNGSLDGLTRQLRRKLGRRIKPLQTAAVPVGSGAGTLISFQNGDRVQSLVVVSAGARTYTLDLVAPAGTAGVSREQGAMVRSFTPAL